MDMQSEKGEDYTIQPMEEIIGVLEFFQQSKNLDQYILFLSQQVGLVEVKELFVKQPIVVILGFGKPRVFLMNGYTLFIFPLKI